VTELTDGTPGALSNDRGSLPQWIYGQIRLNIMTGEYPAGTRLNEQRLAESLEVSRVPLRESFLGLQRDGFIDQLPHRSAVVTGWDAKRVNDLFDARISLEVEAARLATRLHSGARPDGRALPRCNPSR
jgi:DNA-binding GntR family transcriptional regulator